MQIILSKLPLPSNSYPIFFKWRGHIQREFPKYKHGTFCILFRSNYISFEFTAWQKWNTNFPLTYVELLQPWCHGLIIPLARVDLVNFVNKSHLAVLINLYKNHKMQIRIETTCITESQFIEFLPQGIYRQLRARRALLLFNDVLLRTRRALSPDFVQR